VLRKPAYLWAPIVISVIAALPLLAIPGNEGTPSFANRDEFDAYFQSFISALILSTAVAVLLGPISASISYRLGGQFLEGEPAQPFRKGWIELAWRFFLQGLALILLVASGFLAAFIVGGVLQAVVGLPLAILIVGIVAFVLYFGIVARLIIAPAILLSGAGPVESIRRSWQATQGHWGQAIRWLLVVGLTIGILGAVVNFVFGLVLGTIGLRSITPIVGAAVAAPFGMIAAIAYIQLDSLLGGSVESIGSDAVMSGDTPPLPDAVDG
jgi:hypothetical protein